MPRKRRSVSSEDSDDEFDEARHPQRNAANARERARMRVLSKAFCRLKTTLPWVPADTKLSKLDTLRLATSYIAHLRAVLMDQPPPDDNTHKHPLTLTWPFSFQRPDSSPDGPYHESLNAHHNSWVDVPPSQQPVIRDKDKYTEPKETEKYLWNQVITLQEQLEKCWSTNFEISQNLKSSYTAEDFNVTTKYVALQEKHQDLYQKIRTLESELENFKIVSTTDIEKLTSQLENSIKKQKEEGKTSIREIQEQIENENSDHNQRVQQLYNELDLAQAATALQQDEVETELCKELVDINVKIRQMQKINVDVLSEIESLKCRQQKALMENQNLRTLLYTTEKGNFQIDQLITDNRQQQSNSIKVVANFPENKQISHKEENTANLQYIKTIQNIPNKKKQNNVIATKYQPLSVSETKLNYTINKNKNLDSTKSSKKPSKDESIKVSSKIRQPGRENLAQDSHLEGGAQNSHKKRRLFDPDDLDYLNNIEISQT